jgi:enoyl-CoA hydratase
VEDDEVIIERRGSVLVITINRPQAKNALNLRVATGIRDAADELDADSELRVGVLAGAGGVFSAGMDLKAFLRGESPSFEGRGLCGITETPPRKPMIAAVEGWALAGGFELMLACDLVVASRSARFGVPEVKRSLVAAAGGCSPGIRSTRSGPPTSVWSTGSWTRARRSMRRWTSRPPSRVTGRSP